VPARRELTAAEIDDLGRALDEIRARELASLGECDARYIRRVIGAQRLLEVGGRAAMFAAALPPAWIAGTVMLTGAKILENMEIGHNVLHGQWDWMGDPAVHSHTWEWDAVSPAAQWRRAHNIRHHAHTNVLGRDRDIGFGILRMAAAQRWRPVYLAQPLYNLVLAATFEWGIAIFDAEIDQCWNGERTWRELLTDLGAVARKGGRQLVKDYVLFPGLAGPSFRRVLLGNLAANLARNVWAHTVIFCGHFPEGAEVFTPEQVEAETRGEWYVRQLLGSANIDGSALFHILTGNLSHQIEHHLFPDLPSNRYAKIAPEVRSLCERYGIPYTSGPLSRQTAQVWRRLLRLALPGPAEPGAPGARVVPDAVPLPRQGDAAVRVAEAVGDPRTSAGPEPWYGGSSRHDPS
jgi:linoleoyl-CoA desaturase